MFAIVAIVIGTVTCAGVFFVLGRQYEILQQDQEDLKRRIRDSVAIQKGEVVPISDARTQGARK